MSRKGTERAGSGGWEREGESRKINSALVEGLFKMSGIHGGNPGTPGASGQHNLHLRGMVCFTFLYNLHCPERNFLMKSNETATEARTLSHQPAPGGGRGEEKPALAGWQFLALRPSRPSLNPDPGLRV